jgi:hypothetical protein
MKIYYLHENNVNVGPFSIEELKDRKITSFTPIWCEGFDAWKTAGEIDALKSIVKELPSPAEIGNNEKTIRKKINSGFLGFHKKNVIALLVVMIIILLSLIIMNYKSYKIIDIEKTNKEIQKENYTKKIEEQQQKLEEQTKILTEKEQQEKERLNSSRRKADEETYKDILTAISNAYEDLEEAKEELENAKGYRLFRSAKKKQEQINEAEYEIEICIRKIELLKLEKRQMEINLTY